MRFKPSKRIVLLAGVGLIVAGLGTSGFLFRDTLGHLSFMPSFLAKYLKTTDDTKTASSAKEEAHALAKKLDAEATGHSAAADGEAAPELRGTAHGEASAKEADGGGHGAKEEVIELLPYAPPHSNKSRVVQQLRKLQSVQARLALGDKTVADEQKDSLLGLEVALARRKIDSKNPQEIYAVVIYLLSGGRPEPVEFFLKTAKLPKKQKDLLEGSIAYVKGDPAAAADLLTALDPKEFPALLAGQLAMIQSSLPDHFKPAERSKKLKFAINSLPGTLIEEASLRRLVKLSAESLDAHSFLKASNRYIRRFPQSLYGSEFRRDFLNGIVRFDVANKPVDADALDLVLLELDEPRRHDLLESLARQSLSKGLRGLCQYAAGRARRLSFENSSEWTRATLYYIACGVVEEGGDVIGKLDALNVSGLGPDDQFLQKMARRLAARVHLKEPFPGVPDATQIALQPVSEDIEKLKASVAQQLDVTKGLIERAK